MDMMCAHGAAVVRGSWHALVGVDMPFGSYEQSPAQAFECASRIMKETGCAAVKLEGGEAMAPTIEFLTHRGIPVIGIGASAECDGQVLVTEDMLGLFERTPRFVKRYDDLAGRIGEAAAAYATEVRARHFPTDEQTYRPK
jgi:ketopantoate hydroxymethyltransferase